MAFWPKVLATAAGITMYEVAIRPLVAGRTRKSASEDDEGEDDFLDEDWESDDTED